MRGTEYGSLFLSVQMALDRLRGHSTCNFRNNRRFDHLLRTGFRARYLFWDTDFSLSPLLRSWLSRAGNNYLGAFRRSDIPTL